MPSPPMQSSPPSILFVPSPSSGVASTDPILDIPSLSRPSKPVLETTTSPIRDDDTGGGSFPERPSSPSPTTLTQSPTVGTKILHRDAVVLFAKQIKKLKSKLKTKKRKLVLSDSENEEDARQSQELDALLDLANAALHEPSHSSTPFKPVYPDQSSEQEISPTSLDVVLTLSQSKTRAREAKIIYKRLKKQQSSSGLDFSNAAILAVGRVSAGGADPAVVILAGGTDPADVFISAGGADPADVVVSAGGADSIGTFIFVGISVTAGPFVPSTPSSPIRDLAKGNTIATPSSPFTAPFNKELTRIPTGVSTTADASKSASVPIIDLLDSLPKATSLPLDPAKTEQAVPLRKSTRKKSMARRRTLSRPSQSESAALPFDEDDPEAEFKKYLRQVSYDDEPAEPVSLSLVSDIRTWEIIPTEFGLGEIYVITKADGTVKRFSTLRELMHWVGRADLMVLYGMVSDKYKLERATGIGLGLWSNLQTLITAREDRDASIIWDDQDQWEIQSWRLYALPTIHVLETKAGDIMYMFVDKKYLILSVTIQRMLNHGLEIYRDPSGNDLTTTIQLIQSLLNQLHPAT
nr:hypothetical protein [Tanacetum cinerariifolium]